MCLEKRERIEIVAILESALFKMHNGLIMNLEIYSLFKLRISYNLV